MAIESQHPQYSDHLIDWTTMRDTYKGERAVKEKGFTYLPATPGQVADGLSSNQQGYKNYLSYKLRARFPTFVGDAVRQLIGVMHHKPPTIELPKKMQPLMERATVKGESLPVLLRRINEEQMTTGRVGILADIMDGAQAGTLPYIALYTAEDIVNWDDAARDELVRQTLNLVVLNESEDERTPSGFEWETKTKYRVLLLGDLAENEPEGIYRAGVFRQDGGSGLSFNEETLVTPAIAGKTMNQIPFVFINARDIVPEPEDPPFLGLARLALTVYRGEADYRQTLFMQGQDTLVITGSNEEDDIRAGAGAVITVPIGGDAKYIGVSSEGLAEQRTALENDRGEAASAGSRLLDTQGKEAESGNALRIRVSARTASLNQIAQAGATGLQEMLRMMAEWVGAAPEEVSVTPNLDFADTTLAGDDLVKYITAKTLGAPFSKESIHRVMQERDLTQMSFEEEMAAIAAEEPETPGGEGDPDPETDEE